MSNTSAVAHSVSSIDWSTVAAASAVFLATGITTVYGWLQGRKKFQQALNPEQGQQVPIVGGIIQDNQSIREATMVNREVRDQLLMLNHNLMQHNRNLEEVADLLETVAKQLKKRANNEG